MLDGLIADLLRQTRPVDKRLNGGAILRWLPQQNTLIACRPHVSLESGEAATFESYIRRAGCTHSKRLAYQGEMGGVTHIGVSWRIGVAKTEPVQEGLW